MAISELREGWWRHRKVLLDLLERFEEDHLSFKPWEGAMTLGELALHVAQSAEMFVHLVEGTSYEPSGQIEPASAGELQSLVRQATERTEAVFARIPDDRLNLAIDWGPYTATGKTWLEIMRDHEIHHKGQLFVYARMLGISELPFFLRQPPKREA
ncbi:DinB family protein [Staphylospora marina]|uniref:DinB family protein n=1 Tax=Staphylospora marina TaxID=2490858 RepID=UPI000F5C116F|nr:DinB family protein [Staphylospora marina]